MSFGDLIDWHDSDSISVFYVVHFYSAMQHGMPPAQV